MSIIRLNFSAKREALVATVGQIVNLASWVAAALEKAAAALACLRRLPIPADAAAQNHPISGLVHDLGVVIRAARS